MSARILVTGSRNWTDREVIHGALFDAWRELGGPGGNEVTLMHGDCPTGADALADEIWREYAPAQSIRRFPADWSRGKKAGPERNAQMVALGADLCLAFPLGASRGTRGCMRLAMGAGIPVWNYDPQGGDR